MICPNYGSASHDDRYGSVSKGISCSVTTDMADVERLITFGSSGVGHIPGSVDVIDSSAGEGIGFDFLKCDLRLGRHREER